MNKSKIETPFGRIEDGKLIVDFTKEVPCYYDLSILAHDTAREKGFWDEDRTAQHSLAMVGTEIVELLDEIERKSLCPPIFMDDLYFEGDMEAVYDNQLHTVSGEAIDIIIRCLDIFGNAGLGPIEIIEYFSTSIDPHRLTHESAMRALFAAVKDSSKREDWLDQNENLQFVIQYALRWANLGYLALMGAEDLSLSIRAHIVAKILFNKTRPAKHGKIA